MGANEMAMKVRIYSPKGKVLRGEFTVERQDGKTLWLVNPVPKSVKPGDVIVPVIPEKK
jgi:hypothetical protein